MARIAFKRTSNLRRGTRLANAEATSSNPHIRHHFDGQSRSEHQRRVVTGQIVSQKPQSDPCQPRAQKSDLLRQKKMAKDRVAENVEHRGLTSIRVALGQR